MPALGRQRQACELKTSLVYKEFQDYYTEKPCLDYHPTPPHPHPGKKKSQ